MEGPVERPNVFYFTSDLLASLNTVLMDQAVRGLGKEDRAREGAVLTARRTLAGGLDALEEAIRRLEENAWGTVKGLHRAFFELALRTSGREAEKPAESQLPRPALHEAKVWLLGSDAVAPGEVVSSLGRLRRVIEEYVTAAEPRKEGGR